ncbi:MAG TPA: MATE family efflux transporter [Aeromicrobium sp.]|nr:MATE family efflux transporter [Aeromicrobium sp.]HKY58944.1 MATE family efflux transporter [Aeromicrobium sp.]
MTAVRFTGTDRQIFRIAVPALFALVSEPLMVLADTAIIGHLGTTPLAGLAIAATVLNTVVGLCIFLAYGSTAAVARSHGAGAEKEAHAIAVSGLWLAVALGAVLAVMLGVGAETLTGWFASSPAVADQASIYLAITAAALPAMLLGLAATGALRGELDLRTPLLVTVVANLVNVALNLVFVYGLHMGIAGSALGTALAQWGAALWLAAIVALRARRAGALTRPHPEAVLSAARDGVPLFARTVTLRIALLLPTILAARLGDASLAAHQVAMAVVTFIAYGLDAIAIAGQTLTGRALGAGDAEETRRLARRMMGWGLVTGLAAGAALAVASPLVVIAFTGDSAVRQALLPALLVIAMIQPLSGVVFVLDGLLIGAGDGRYLAWAGFVTLAVYAPVAVVLAGWGFTWLWVAYAAFMLARLVTLGLRERSDRWMVLGNGRAALA